MSDDPLLEAHRVIKRCVGELRATDAITEVRRILDDLHAVLPDHFAYEERPGGYFDHLKRVRRHPVVPALLAEHGEFLDELDALRVDDIDDAELIARARTLAARLARHEAEENRLGATPSFAPGRTHGPDDV